MTTQKYSSLKEGLTELVKALQAIEACNEIKDDNHFDYLHGDDHPLAHKAEELAGSLLPSKDGGVKLEAYIYLKERGYKVGPGETDGFGWLSGVIQTKKGQLVFF